MEDEISIGEYVRNEAGIIYKILSAVKNTFLCIEIRENATKIEVLSDLEPVVKHNKDIIDLIQEDDLIEIEYETSDKTIQNEVVQVIRNFQGILYVNTFVGKFFIQDLEHYNRKILSIITKEQIKQIEFRIKK